MALACDEADKCGAVASAFSVGAVVVTAGGEVAATGHSRELPGNMHAEEVAFAKLRAAAAARGVRVADLLGPGATLYTTMEPCGVRLSGKTPCSTRALDAGVGRVVYAIAEPPVFVVHTLGLGHLADAHVPVSRLHADAPSVARSLAANAHLAVPVHTAPAPAPPTQERRSLH